jgi:hypothetical protein
MNTRAFRICRIFPQAAPSTSSSSSGWSWKDFRLNESEQEWSNDEMRHLVQEIKAKWFPCPQPYLDVLTDKVVFYNCSWEQWWNEDLPHLIEILPKLKSCEKIEPL